MKYPKLPIMQCDDGCGECCGFAPCSRQEFNNIKSYIVQHGIEPIRQGATCPLYQNGTCSVYPVRPFVCRLFGHCSDLVCCRGYNRNIDPAFEERLVAIHQQECGDEMLHTHDLCYEPMEIVDLFRAEVER